MLPTSAKLLGPLLPEALAPPAYNVYLEPRVFFERERELWTRQAADTHPPKRRYTAMQATLSRPWSEERPPSLDFSGTSWF